eukprot:TRINITY_DN12387_c0_g1_i1.p1 TRINITY_DN12387_c0_g1~~TRINITY_DN12387_c0_g1_i1.p1  ORF type:complete len:427 (-),score=31.51 TRINITY_DN12387_c0_g1_i1:40-1320(-)
MRATSVAVLIAAFALYFFDPQPLVVNVVISVLSGLLTWQLIPSFYELFIKANLYGIDLSKVPKDPKQKVPESMGVICGAFYMISLFIFLLVLFLPQYMNETLVTFRTTQLNEFLSGLLSICCMIFLGFADDVLNLRWRHKLLLPTIATLPILIVYIINIGSTTVLIPQPLVPFLGQSVLNLGVFFYIYMGMLAVFCTNAINILAGINGVEAGQSLVIGISILVNNYVQLSGPSREHHLLSMYFIIPFIILTAALLYYNWYPSRVFVGDTFCYWAGMTFAVVGILGHFSKTMILFFIPQIINFLYSVPQLFKFVPCPRHRLPKFNPKTNKLGMSLVELKKSDLGALGRVTVTFLRLFRLVHYEERKEEGEVVIVMNNFTIINFVIKLIGPTHEQTLTIIVLLFQVLCSCCAFFIRYYLAGYVYEKVE